MVLVLVVKTVEVLVNFLEIAIFIDVILSWVAPGMENTFTDILHSITDVLYYPGRKLQEMLLPNFGLDFSPIVAILILGLIEAFV